MLQLGEKQGDGRKWNMLGNLNLPIPSKNENNLPLLGYSPLYHKNGFQDLSYGEFLICKMMNFCFSVSSALHEG